MAKKFNELTVGDIVYHVFINRMEYEKLPVRSVSSDGVEYKYRDYTERTGNYTALIENNGQAHYLFTKETDAIRYCKAQVMKNLFSRIEKAKKAIAEVKEFRDNNFELLNHRWTELEIQRLEKQIL